MPILPWTLCIPKKTFQTVRWAKGVAITPVKANQKKLLKQINLLYTQHKPYERYVDSDTTFKRGRKEIRQVELFDPREVMYFTSPQSSSINNNTYDNFKSNNSKYNNSHKHKTSIYPDFSKFGIVGFIQDEDWNRNIKLVARVTRTRQVKTYFKDKESDKVVSTYKTSTQIINYISSSNEFTAKYLNELIRSHWSIENCNHYVRDEILKEDKSRIRKNAGALARIRSLAMNVLRANKTKNIQEKIQQNGWGNAVFREYEF